MMPKRNVYVSTVPFSSVSPEPLARLEAAGLQVRINPHRRKMTRSEMMSVLPDTDYLVAGIETLDAEVLASAPRLRLISRVGIGLDAIAFDACRARNIQVTYTPDAPTLAVAELNVGLALDALRQISTTTALMHRGVWQPAMGSLLRGKTVGLLGFGRIGKTTAQLLQSFRVQCLACDPVWDIATARALAVERCDLPQLLAAADILFVCVPIARTTRNLIGAAELSAMKPTAILINTARGGIVVEADLANALRSGQLQHAALDVFAEEPYSGELADLDNCTLTAHMAAAAAECRAQMELEAVCEVVRFVHGEPLLQPAPFPSDS
jgi:D-3-phosphoglycerate dehydrogenase